MKLRNLSILALIAIFLLGACNLPGSANSSKGVQTAAAETVSAQLTLNAQLTPSSTNTSAPTATLPPTNTPAVTNTAAPTSSSGGAGNTGCDSVQFVTDVTIPDGEKMAPNTDFVKTWRLRNAGTCTWSTSYSAVFVSGNAMGGQASQALTGSIVPGSTMDLSVNLKSPATVGDYTGYWALRNASGQNFGSFYVEIEVTGTGSGGSSGGTTFSVSNQGQVDAGGNVASTTYAGSVSGVGTRAFVSFNISSIPANATIQSVQVDFSGFDTTGNPFATMGCLQGFAGTYFPLDASDYSVPGAGPDMEWCSTGELSSVTINDDVKERLEDALGSSTLEYQLRFTGAPSGNLYVRFLGGGAKLIVTYTIP
ncbi:MAG: NBR1-Ig-like domain-containing protein [Anaerolineales bacterium]